MSSPQTESPAPVAPKEPKAKKPKLTPEQQAVVDLMNLNAAERAHRNDLVESQATVAKMRRLEKAARKDPAVAEILDQNKAQGAVIEQLREELSSVTEAGRSATALLEEAGKVNQEQHGQIEALKSELEMARGQNTQAGVDLDQANAKLAEIKAKLGAAEALANSQADELAKARADLAAALKAKK